MEGAAKKAISFWDEFWKGHPNDYCDADQGCCYCFRVAGRFGNQPKQKKAKHSSGEDAGKLPPNVEYTFYADHRYTRTHSEQPEYSRSAIKHLNCQTFADVLFDIALKNVFCKDCGRSIHARTDRT